MRGSSTLSPKVFPPALSLSRARGAMWGKWSRHQGGYDSRPTGPYGSWRPSSSWHLGRQEGSGSNSSAKAERDGQGSEELFSTSASRGAVQAINQKGAHNKTGSPAAGLPLHVAIKGWVVVPPGKGLNLVGVDVRPSRLRDGLRVFGWRRLLTVTAPLRGMMVCRPARSRLHKLPASGSTGYCPRSSLCEWHGGSSRPRARHTPHIRGEAGGQHSPQD